MNNEITVTDIIKKFKIQKPTTGKIELTIIDDMKEAHLYIKCVEGEHGG